MRAVDIPILDYVLKRLEQSKGQLPRVATESGVPYRTLQKIASGETKDPGVSIVQKLADYYRGSAEGPPSKIPGPVEEGGRPSSPCSESSGAAHVPAEIGGGV